MKPFYCDMECKSINFLIQSSQTFTALVVFMTTNVAMFVLQSYRVLEQLCCFSSTFSTLKQSAFFLYKVKKLELSFTVFILRYNIRNKNLTLIHRSTSKFLLHHIPFTISILQSLTTQKSQKLELAEGSVLSIDSYLESMQSQLFEMYKKDNYKFTTQIKKTTSYIKGLPP